MTPSVRLLAERLNGEAPIFRGCSSSEIGLITGLAVLIWLPVSLIAAWALGAAAMGLGLAGIAIVLTVVVTGSVFQRIKSGRPDGYYQQRLALALASARLRPPPFIRRDGDWSIGRRRSVG